MNPIIFIWAIPIFFCIHELEEWNILNWYKKYYRNLPPSTNFSIHLHIFTFCIAGFILTSIAILFQTTFLFSFIICFLSGFILLNVFQHIVWTVQLKAYSPGLISGLILLAVTAFVNSKLISNNLIQLPFYIIILLAIIPGIKTIKIKNEMTPEIRRVHNLFISIENRLKARNTK
jgi:di/tricarboxylate transporter